MLMEAMTKHGGVGLAALKAGMDRKTARKYIVAGTLPSEMRAPRDWRTREDPFAEHRDEVRALLRETPGLEAETVFELLALKYPDRYAPGQLRTLQRRDPMLGDVEQARYSGQRVLSWNLRGAKTSTVLRRCPGSR
jgi:hypothetical protein